MLPDKDSINNYYIYTYTFLDDLSSIINPHERFANTERYKIDDAIFLIEERFKRYGWEGDGEIGIIWLPPFVDEKHEDTFGVYL